jgi:hypothetical protein
MKNLRVEILESVRRPASEFMREAGNAWSRPGVGERAFGGKLA